MPSDVKRSSDRSEPPRQRGAAPPVRQLGAAGNRAVSRLLAPSDTGPVVQRDVVSDVEERMSYGAFDWAVTDQEAIDSLNDLATLPTAALATTMARLSATAKSRLLDNMPASARATSGFAKVLVAMGPAAVQPYVQNLLSYGVFDWAITDADAEAVFRIMVALQPAQQVALTRRLGAMFRHRLADNLQRSATIGDAEQAALRALFDATPDAELGTLKMWMHIRFRIEIGTQTSGAETAQEWDGPSLRRMYNVLQSLPPGAVERNPELARIDRYKDAGPAGGYYSGGDGRVAIGYGDIRARGGIVDPVQPGRCEHGRRAGAVAGAEPVRRRRPARGRSCRGHAGSAWRPRTASATRRAATGPPTVTVRDWPQ